MPASPSYATAELTWGLVLAAMRQIPQQMASLKAGRWQIGGRLTRCAARRSGIYGYGRIGSVVAGYGRAFGMNVVIWASEDVARAGAADGYDGRASKEAFFERLRRARRCTCGWSTRPEGSSRPATWRA